MSMHFAVVLVGALLHRLVVLPGCLVVLLHGRALRLLRLSDHALEMVHAHPPNQ